MDEIEEGILGRIKIIMERNHWKIKGNEDNKKRMKNSRCNKESCEVPYEH